MKKILFMIAAVGFTTLAKAQFIANDLGASIFVGSATIAKNGQTEKLLPSFYGVSWYPRYMLGSSLSVGVPLTLGFSGSFNSREGSSFSFGLDGPVAVDYNFGYGAAGSNEDYDGGFGGFVGVGFGYTKATSAAPETYNGAYWTEADFSASSSYGPMGHAGVRFPIKQGEKSITIRLSYKKGLEKTKFNFFGGTLLYSL
jgi:hypothetical protein